MFIHVVETGLQQESVQAKLRPLLDKKGVTDEELLEQLNKAVSAESERNNKMGTVKHNQVSVNMTSCNDSTNENKSSSKEAKQNKLMAALEAVQADAASLREAFHKTQVTQIPNLQEVSSNTRVRNYVMLVRRQERDNVLIVLSVGRRALCSRV